ncbi:MAG TPA: class I SAM-dependent methyltransferase [Nitrososphaerales archaeon]|nr:class I SAM-dependent methyltransferase [Nitrososphaerales archaeon]
MTDSPKLYTEFAKFYDRLESQYRDYDLEAKWLTSIIEAHESRRVIDISCGTGNHLSALIQNAGNREFIAMDSSVEMVGITRSKTKASNLEILLGDFLWPPLVQSSFDLAICMYWSLAGLDHALVKKLFLQVNTILRNGGIFVFDVENAEGIKENLLNEPFIDAFFEDKDGSSVIRANLSKKITPDLVDWHAYYLIEDGGVSKLSTDAMKLRFYSKDFLSKTLDECGFSLHNVYSAPFVEYREHSPSLYFVAEKRKQT